MSPIPEQFDNATILTKANVYQDGKVISHTVLRAGQDRVTLGVILPGSYSFGTGAPERMEVVAGVCRVKLAGAREWRAYPAGSTFRVPGNSSFDIAVDEGVAEYVCTFEGTAA